MKYVEFKHRLENCALVRKNASTANNRLITNTVLKSFQQEPVLASFETVHSWMITTSRRVEIGALLSSWLRCSQMVASIYSIFQQLTDQRTCSLFRFKKAQEATNRSTSQWPHMLDSERTPTIDPTVPRKNIYIDWVCGADSAKPL